MWRYINAMISFRFEVGGCCGTGGTPHGRVAQRDTQTLCQRTVSGPFQWGAKGAMVGARARARARVFRRAGPLGNAARVAAQGGLMLDASRRIAIADDKALSPAALTVTR